MGFRERETGKQQHAQLATQSSLHVNKFGTDRRDDGRPPSWLTNILVCKYNIFQTFGSGRGPRVWPFRGEVACPSCAGFTADSALWVTILAGGRRFSRCRHGAVCAARRWTDQLQPAWCSLPPLPGPFQHRPHVSALLLGTRAPPHRTNTQHYGASLMSHISTPATSTTFANIGNLSSHNIGKARYSYYSLDKMAQKHINYEVLIIYVL